MVDSTQSTQTQSAQTQSVQADSAAPATPSAEEVAEVIAELQGYRDRLVEDFTAAAKKAKLPKSMAMAQLKNHPEILKIDAALAQLKGEEQSV